MRPIVQRGKRRAMLALSSVLAGSLLLAACSQQAAQTSKPATKPTFPADSYMAKIQQRGKLIASGKTELPGIGYLNPQTNKNEGFGVDLAEDIALRIFGEPGHMEWKSADPKTRIPMLQEGVADVNIETAFILPERKEQIDFADPYWASPTRIFVAKNNDTIKSKNDLNGKIVSTSKGSSTEIAISKGDPNYPKAELLLFDNNAATVEAVKTGRAAATTFDEAIGLSIMKNDPDSFKFVGENLDYNYYGIGLAKGHPEFVKFLNDWLADLRTTGKWKEIYKKNLPGDVPEPPAPPFDKAYH
jgi:aspartate/glutamate/glutamine transport system substrate-binding protein